MPSPAVWTERTAAVPVIAGRTELVSARPISTSVTTVAAVAVPPSRLVAVTRTPSVDPTSAATVV